MDYKILSGLFVFFYFLFIIIIGILSKRKETKEDFLIAGREIGSVNIAASLCAGFIGGGFLILLTSYSFSYGISALWMVIGQAMGLIIFGIISKKIRAEKEKLYTLPDYFYNKFDRKNGFLSAVIILSLLVAFIIIQLIGGGTVLQSITGWSYSTCVILMGAAVLFYLSLGGFKAVIKTDLFQYFLIFMLLIIISTSSFKYFKDSYNIGLDLFSIGVSKIIGFFLFGFFFILIGADVWQRVYAAKNVKSLRKGFFYSALLMIIIGVFICFFGIAVKSGFPYINPEDAFAFGFSEMIPKYLMGIGLVVIFSAIMSTADSLIFAAAMTISKDLVSRFKNLTEKKLVFSVRFFIAMIVFTCVLFAVFFKDIIDIGFIFMGLALSLAPAILGSVFFRLKNKAVFWSIFLTSILVLFAVFVFNIKEEISIISVFCSAMLLFLGQKIFK